MSIVSARGSVEFFIPTEWVQWSRRNGYRPLRDPTQDECLRGKAISQPIPLVDLPAPIQDAQEVPRAIPPPVPRATKAGKKGARKDPGASE